MTVIVAGFHLGDRLAQPRRISLSTGLTMSGAFSRNPDRKLDCVFVCNQVSIGIEWALRGSNEFEKGRTYLESDLDEVSGESSDEGTTYTGNQFPTDLPVWQITHKKGPHLHTIWSRRLLHPFSRPPMLRNDNAQSGAAFFGAKSSSFAYNSSIHFHHHRSPLFSFHFTVKTFGFIGKKLTPFHRLPFYSF